jgi:serine/threonine-protein kinase RsbT
MVIMGSDGASYAERRLPIATDLDVVGARSAVRRIADVLAFSPTEVAELVIVVSELASNILKYARPGEIVVDAVPDPKRGLGLRIVASDKGPPFHDLSVALRDGHGDRGPVLPEHLVGRKGIGSGLGAVIRFTDSFECDQSPTGKRITVVRFRRASKPRGMRG